jgi:hypothetical protein
MEKDKLPSARQAYVVMALMILLSCAIVALLYYVSRSQ